MLSRRARDKSWRLHVTSPTPPSLVCLASEPGIAQRAVVKKPLVYRTIDTSVRWSLMLMPQKSFTNAIHHTNRPRKSRIYIRVRAHAIHASIPGVSSAGVLPEFRNVTTQRDEKFGNAIASTSECYTIYYNILRRLLTTNMRIKL